jgi:uncharacterized protein YidB (DUF937 family)
VLNDSWVSEPKRQKIDINDLDVREKYKNYRDRKVTVLTKESLAVAEDMWNDIKRMRKAGLEKGGEFSTENLVFKMLRNQGWLEKLNSYIGELQDEKLSIEQRLI